MCFSNDDTNITLAPIACFLSISTIPCNNTNGFNADDEITFFDNIILFEDVLEAERKPTRDRSIFFIESSCIKNGLATLSAR